MKRILIVLCLLIAGGNMMGQFSTNGACGLSPAEDDLMMQRLRKNKHTLEENEAGFQSHLVSYVPIVFHLVRRTDGSGGARFSRLADQVCSLNEYYAQQNTNLNFYVKEINIINDFEAYFLHYESLGAATLNENRQDKVINIFMVGDANTMDSNVGRTLGYYAPEDDWIVIRKDEISGDSETLFHEIGHFFSLPHPFRGWDFEAYNPAVHGQQVGEYASSTGFSSPIRNELQDGSNCETAGDEICDTPPDYNHASVDWECNYVGAAQDPSGTLIDPDEKNIMGYFISCAGKRFSEKQKGLMGADLFNRYVAETIELGAGGTSISGAPQLQNPADNSNQKEFNALTFSWAPMNNAEQYILEIDNSPSFAFGTLQLLVEENSIVVESDYFEAEKEYYWRIRPINSYSFCTNWSDNFSFSTYILSSSQEPIAPLSFNLSPNLIHAGNFLNLHIHSQEKTRAQITVYTIAGQKIINSKHQDFPSGNTTHQLDLTHLNPGFYLLAIETTTGILQKRFIVH